MSLIVRLDHVNPLIDIGDDALESARAFVPVPNRDWQIDRRVLELMDRNLTLDEIARALRSEFPTRFRDWNAALTRAGDLSEKYSR